MLSKVTQPATLLRRNYRRRSVYAFIITAFSLCALPATSNANSGDRNTPAIVSVSRIEQQRLNSLPDFIDKMVADQIANSEVAGAIVTVVL